MDEMVAIAAFDVQESHLDEALEVVAANLVASHGEAGIRRLALHRSLRRPNRLVAIEVYNDEAAVKSHRQSAHLQATVERLVPLLAGGVESRWVRPVPLGDPVKGQLSTARHDGSAPPPNPIVVVSVLTPRAGTRDAVVDVLRPDIELTQAEAGNRRFALHLGVDESSELVVIEVFEDEAAIEHHFTTSYLQAVAEQLPALLEAPVDVERMDPIPIGDPFKGQLAAD